MPEVYAISNLSNFKIQLNTTELVVRNLLRSKPMRYYRNIDYASKQTVVTVAGKCGYITDFPNISSAICSLVNNLALIP